MRSDYQAKQIRRSRERGCCGFGLEFEDDVTTTSFYIKSKLVPTFEYRIGDAIVKRNGNNHAQFLEGAKFGLYEVTDGVMEENASYTAVSDANGVVNSWEDTQGETIVESKDLPTGTYILKEEAAPGGYSKSEDTWKIEITATSVVITLNNSPVDKLTEDEKEWLKTYTRAI